MNKRLYIIINFLCLLLPLPFLAGYIFSTAYHPTVTIPANDTTLFIYRAYNDSIEHGTSLSSLSRTDKQFIFTFTLKNGYSKPYAGIAIEPKAAHSTINFSRFDLLTFTVKRSSSDTQDIKININTPFPRNTTVRPVGTRINEKIVACLTTESTISVALRDFAPPAWWCEKCKVSDSKIGRETYANVTSLIFQSGETTPRDSEYSFTIANIVFKRDIPVRLRNALLVCLAYYVLFRLTLVIIFIYRRQKSRSKKTIIEYQPLSVNNYLDEETGRLVKYIGMSFNKHNLTLEQVARDVGLPQKKVSQILNKKYQQNFKHYLNGIRIEEAKRLLKETDRQTSDIAGKVGFSTVPHFNRVFKEYVDMTPLEFRNQKLQNGDAEEGEKS